MKKEPILEVPEYAVDSHTKRGREAGANKAEDGSWEFSEHYEMRAKYMEPGPRKNKYFAKLISEFPKTVLGDKEKLDE